METGNGRHPLIEGRIQPEKYEVRGKIEYETPNAVLVNMTRTVVGHQVQRREWFPLSQVHSMHRTFIKLGYDSVFVTAWIAKQKGLIDA